MTEPYDPHPDRYLDSGAYAADALSPEEVAAFEAAMAADPALRTRPTACAPRPLGWAWRGRAGRTA